MPISLRHNHLSPAVPVLPATHLSLQPQIQSALHTLKKREIEGSQATAKQTAELLRSVISQQRLPQTNQATTLINAVRAVREKLIAANPVELAVGNIARRVLHIIREEDFSLATAAIAGLELSAHRQPLFPTIQPPSHHMHQAASGNYRSLFRNLQAEQQHLTPPDSSPSHAVDTPSTSDADLPLSNNFCSHCAAVFNVGFPPCSSLFASTSAMFW
ncbi:hypothetical protein RYX36_009563 [Vicia faba]